jgi:hypothetical protein
MKKRGRRTLLTANLQKQLCKLLGQGHTIKTVCEAVGIADRTYYDWQKHPHFSQAITRGVGQSKIFLGEKLRQSDDWRAQAFLRRGFLKEGMFADWNGAGLMSLAEAMPVRCPKSRSLRRRGRA